MSFAWLIYAVERSEMNEEPMRVFKSRALENRRVGCQEAKKSQTGASGIWCKIYYQEERRSMRSCVGQNEDYLYAKTRRK